MSSKLSVLLLQLLAEAKDLAGKEKIPHSDTFTPQLHLKCFWDEKSQSFGITTPFGFKKIGFSEQQTLKLIRLATTSHQGWEAFLAIMLEEKEETYRERIWSNYKDWQNPRLSVPDKKQKVDIKFEDLGL